MLQYDLDSKFQKNFIKKFYFLIKINFNLILNLLKVKKEV